METKDDIRAVTNCNDLNAAKACEVVAKWRAHLEFKFANGFGIDTAADIGRDMLACLDEIKQSIAAPLNINPAENVNSEKVIYNGAKLREAVEAVVEVGYPHNFQREAPHIRSYCYDITKAIEKCYAALSAPARNCDRQFRNAHDVLSRFTAETGRQIFNTTDVINWLLAEAK